MGISAPSVLGGMSASAGSNGKKPFVPRAVANFEETGLSHAMIESLILKFLVNAGTATGRRIAAELGLPFGPFPDFLRQLKNQQIVAYANSADGQRLRLFADRLRPDAREALLRGMRLRRHGAGAVRRLPRVGRRADDHHRASPGGRPPQGVLRPADLRRDLRDARPGDQLGPRDVPLRISGQRQDQHRRADHPLLRHDRLDPQGARRSRARSSSSSTWPTTSRSSSRPPAACSTSSTTTAAGSTSAARRSWPAASCGWKTWRSTTIPRPR